MGGLASNVVSMVVGGTGVFLERGGEVDFSRGMVFAVVIVDGLGIFDTECSMRGD